MTWKQFDGTPVEIYIHKCEDCVKEIEKLMSFNPKKEWINKALDKLTNKRTVQKTVSLVPLVLMVRSVV